MDGFRKTDLRYTYEWNTAEDTCRGVNGFPPNLILNRNEGHEVLHFIIRYMDSLEWRTMTSFNNIEKLIQTQLPVYLQSHMSMKNWLDGVCRQVELC